MFICVKRGVNEKRSKGVRFVHVYIFKSIIYLTMNVKTAACTKKPKVVGHPLLLAIVPTKRDNKEFTSLYVKGLKRSNNTRVV